MLGLFLALIVATDMFFPYSVEQSGYTVVDLRRLQEAPLALEGRAISSSATLVSVTDNGTFFTATSAEGVRLIFPADGGQPLAGERVLIRGISWVDTNDTVVVHEFYALDYTSSLIRSVPGIILFVVLFFMVFRVDFGRLAFVLRRGDDA